MRKIQRWHYAKDTRRTPACAPRDPYIDLTNAHLIDIINARVEELADELGRSPVHAFPHLAHLSPLELAREFFSIEIHNMTFYGAAHRCDFYPEEFAAHRRDVCPEEFEV